jgi:guanylate kinase
MAHLVVLSGPSGVGKSSVIKQALKDLPETWLSVSATTRAPRPGEEHGKNYFYVSDVEFDQMIADGDLLEHASFAGNRYGTPRRAVEERLNNGIPVLLEIEVQGAMQVRESKPDSILVFMQPPSWEELEDRLTGRGTETPSEIRIRLDEARKELDSAHLFDHSIVNDDVNRAAKELVHYLR